jgi:uncharacterized membrane protein YeaQ/YmgE (transglycosylase-associated protein family)
MRYPDIGVDNGGPHEYGDAEMRFGLRDLRSGMAPLVTCRYQGNVEWDRPISVGSLTARMGHRGDPMNVGSFLAALALGFVAGAIARALIPNDAFRHMHGWRSWLTSAALGLLGALVGFWIFHGLFGIGDTQKFDWGGIVGAIIGAMIVVVLASFLIKRFARREAV